MLNIVIIRVSNMPQYSVTVETADCVERDTFYFQNDTTVGNDSSATSTAARYAPKDSKCNSAC